ncbi:MAG: hypothetical protein JST16_04830 [Bdellovibrionales bacterium]|nr:hypothetical protein [Bdellovibrionales bacterium]
MPIRYSKKRRPTSLGARMRSRLRGRGGYSVGAAKRKRAGSAKRKKIARSTRVRRPRGESSWWDVAKAAAPYLGKAAAAFVPGGGIVSKIAETALASAVEGFNESLASGDSKTHARDIGKYFGNLPNRALRYAATRIRGHGDYSVATGTGFKGSAATGGSVPTFASADEGVRIRHREYLGEVSTAGLAFTNQYVLYLNPGLEQTFPWLSTIAANFEEYEFAGVVFEYVSESADALASTNTALGSVMLATQYNANNNPFGTKQEMLEYEMSVSSRPSTSILHAVECAKRRTVLPEMYVRTGLPAQAPGKPQDLRMYDWGIFQLSTYGQQTPCVLGELWISYDVILRKPKLSGGIKDIVHSAAHIIYQTANAGLQGADGSYAITPSTAGWIMDSWNGPTGYLTASGRSSMYTAVPFDNIGLTYGYISGLGQMFTFPSTVADGSTYLVSVSIRGFNHLTGATGTSSVLLAPVCYNAQLVTGAFGGLSSLSGVGNSSQVCTWDNSTTLGIENTGFMNFLFRVRNSSVNPTPATTSPCFGLSSTFSSAFTSNSGVGIDIHIVQVPNIGTVAPF